MKLPSHSLTAILLDDDSTQAYLFARLAEEIDWLELELIHYSQASKAMADLLTQKADIVFLDHHLGEGQSGLDLLRGLRDFGFDGPIVMLTGCNERWIIDNFFRFGADAYIDKAELSSATLSEAVQVALRLPHKNVPRIIRETPVGE